MSASVIIPCFNRRDLTDACLDFLSDTLAEVVLIDNGSTDDTWDLAHRVDVGIRNEKNLGFAAACNQGAFVSTGDYLVFLNNDTEPGLGWLDLLLAPFADPKVGAVGARLVYPNGGIQHAGVSLAVESGVLTARNIQTYHTESDVLAVTGACMAVRKEAFDEVGGFDECYWNGYEDVDLCLQLHAHGWTVAYAPECVVVHHESASGPERWTGVRNNIERLNEKWLPAWRDDLRDEWLTPAT